LSVFEHTLNIIVLVLVRECSTNSSSSSTTTTQVPQIWPLADTVHSKHFIYLLTYLLTYVMPTIVITG